MVAKQLGADDNLAKFIIVVSAAIGAFNFSITFSDLRCIFVTVDEATEKEATYRFFLRCSQTQNLKKKRKEI